MGVVYLARQPRLRRNIAAYSVAFGRAGTLLALGCQDGAIRLWDVQKNRSLDQVLRGHDGGVQSVAFGPDDAFPVSGREDAGVRLWAL